MKFFLDTADIDDIKKLNELSLVDGVTTNPSIIAKSDSNFREIIKEISLIVKGPVSAECVSPEYEKMLKEAYDLAKISDNVAVKVPLTIDGLKVCKILRKEGIMVNVTLCFSANQALLAAKMGASFISPFVGRHDDFGVDGMELIGEILDIYDNYDYKTEVLVASVRNVEHIKKAALLGADIVTVPPKLIFDMYEHPYTKLGIDNFLKDWKNSNKKI